MVPPLFLANQPPRSHDASVIATAATVDEFLARPAGVRACYPFPNNVFCDSWKFWGPGFSGWLELNDDQPSINDGRKFFVQMYGVDSYTTGWIAF